MNLRDLIEQDDGGAMIAQIARQLNVDEDTVRRGVDQLAPAVARGVQRNAAQRGGLDALLEGLGAPRAGGGAAQASGLNGNDILGQIFGSKDVSRNVAGYAANNSGLDSSLLKRMLPLIASAVVMYLSQRARQGGGLGGPAAGSPAPSAGGGSLTDVLGQMLDADRDGSAVDDLLDMARKYF